MQKESSTRKGRNIFARKNRKPFRVKSSIFFDKSCRIFYLLYITQKKNLEENKFVQNKIEGNRIN